jgi:hypothetical protein
MSVDTQINPEDEVFKIIPVDTKLFTHEITELIVEIRFI